LTEPSKGEIRHLVIVSRVHQEGRYAAAVRTNILGWSTRQGTGTDPRDWAD
jgi:hypothetical protein